MAKKKTSLSQTLFGQIDPYGVVLEEALESRPTGAPATLPLEAIRPDPNQPRQLLPLALNRALAAGNLTPVEALRSWLKQTDEANPDVAQHPITELRRLATSIAQHGLINPITVRRAHSDELRPAEVAYVIVTGERRYWSHVLLSIEGRMIHEGTEVIEPSQIKVIFVQPGVSVRAHQLIENLMREDINAIERARGLWALRYELSGVNHGSPGESDQELGLVPWGQVEEALDISKRYRIFITGVLELTPPAQSLVAEYHLSERIIRPIVQKLKMQPDLQLQALHQLIRWREAQDIAGGQNLVASTEALVAQLLDRAEAKDSLKTDQISPPITHRDLRAKQFRSQVQRALGFLNKLEAADLVTLTQNLATTAQYAEVVDELRDLRERIDVILETVSIDNRKNDRLNLHNDDLLKP